MKSILGPLLLSLPFSCAACSNASSSGAGASGPDGGAQDGGKVAFAVGTRRIEIQTPSGRMLPVQLWYPAEGDAGAVERPLDEMEPPGPLRDQLSALVAAAPEPCTNKTIHASDAPPVAGHEEPLPLVVFSHCLNCVRFSELTVSERLASDGFVVAAPDHVGNTMYDQLAGSSTGLTPEVLTVRADDIRAVIDTLLDGGAMAVPDGIRGQLDPDRVGMFGHSFGSVTTGLVLQSDSRVKAGLMMAAPPETPLFPDVHVAQMPQPALFFLAKEDHSIGDPGNTFIQNNFDAYEAPAWLIDVADAGHWSFSDICGLATAFKPGCGQDTRQKDPTAQFSYIDNVVARGLASRYTSAFFRAALLGDEAATASLGVADPSAFVSITHHE